MLKNGKIEKYILDIYKKKLGNFKFLPSDKWAIYGTGNGAEVILEILREWNLDQVIVAIIDNDEVVGRKPVFYGFKVTSLEEIYEKIDGIIIGSMDFHEIVNARVLNQLKILNDNRLKVVNLFGYNTDADVREYVNYVEELNGNIHKKTFVEFDEKGIQYSERDTKIIAWYLPQFHRIDTNDFYYGRGFTEWTNTTKAIPMFTGHYQPHIPYDVGYYDLNNPEVFERQIFLAKHYGIYGFSFYYYWFSGSRIMEKPLQYFLNHKELDIKYCVTWANENWSALWDGGNKDLIFEQRLKPGDDKLFMDDIYPYMSDDRYISINGKKLLIVYRATVWGKNRVRELFNNFRNEAKKSGLGELYIMLCNARGFDEDVKEWGADALVEFPPHGIGAYAPVIRVAGYMNPKFIGHVRDTGTFIKNRDYLYKHNSKDYYRGAMPSWDNTSRKAYNGATIYTGLSPETFEQWMTDIIVESKKIHGIEQDFVFINAWNEWAEGTHLEPDLMYGYANLSAVKNALEKTRIKT